ncbi:MAG: aminotransferase class V-fold PLP-dependent enzyme [Actinomycetota bacterium]|nr:aminotransferase class V-fold PLP-dependent enzyme [Actinomycetota bacterium]
MREFIHDGEQGARTASPHVAPEIIRARTAVRCADGSLKPSRYLDYAATAPALSAAADAALEVLPYYGSIHRGAGVESRTSTAAYEGARTAVSSFLGASSDHIVVFVRNTTEALNLLAHCLPAGARVLSTPGEHHANMLPWRRREVDLLPFTGSAEELLARSAGALASRRYDLFAVSGASNVTGEIAPIRELAALAHRHGAEICVDAAQLSPHAPIDMQALGIDHLALSGHKLYAPFGVGALIARRQRIAGAEPLLHGGGAVARVLEDRVVWADAPARFEAGTPNVFGAIALGAACDVLAAYGMGVLALEEQTLGALLRQRLAGLTGVRVLSQWAEADTPRVALTSFHAPGLDAQELARRLAEEHAISVRAGAFCAHPLVRHLRAASRGAGEGAVRASLGIGSGIDDVEALAGALEALVGARGKRTHRQRPSARLMAPVAGLLGSR